MTVKPLPEKLIGAVISKRVVARDAQKKGKELHKEENQRETGEVSCMSELNATAVIFNMKEPIYRKLVKWEVRWNSEKQGKLQSTKTLPMEWKYVEQPGRLEEHCLNEEGYPRGNTVEMGVNMHMYITQCGHCTEQNNQGTATLKL